MGEQAYNLIFLDVDGVLNTKRDHHRMDENHYFVRDDLVEKLVKIIIETDARVVLSSTWRYSVPMTEYIRETLARILQSRGYSNLGQVDNPEEAPLEAYFDVIISVTPDLEEPRYEQPPLPENSHQTRTDEILLWLKENAVLSMEHQVRKMTPEHTKKAAGLGCIEEERWLLNERIRVNNFICLDDMNLYFYSCYRLKSLIKRHLVLTKREKGLTSRHVKEAITKLRSDFDIEKWAAAAFVPCTRPSCFHNKLREDQKIIEEIKRSSINANLGITPTKQHSAPGPQPEPRHNENKRSKSDVGGYGIML